MARPILKIGKPRKGSEKIMKPSAHICEKVLTLPMMETRTVRYEQPRLGDHVRYFGADLSVSDKSRHSRRWALNATTGALLGISDSVGVCIDLNARRAIEVPEELRGDMSRHHLPQLA